MKQLYSFLIAFFCLMLSVQAQDSTSSWMEQLDNPTTYTIATFKATRLINMHTVETLGKRTLDFRISHRFGTFNSGAENLWGLDGGASIRLGLEYSYDGRLMGGIGRTSTGKMFDGFLKYRLVRQTDDNHTPLSITLLTAMYITHESDPNKEANGYDKYENFSSRMSYAYQAIIARKFTSAFSLQIVPYFIHYNQVDAITDLNDMYGVQAGMRLKFTKRAAITAEYAFRINDYTREEYYNSLGIGLELETGGHVFQVHITNSFGIVENQFLPYTDTKWGDGGIRLGFNISRVFTL
jgi:hypothetical protein